MNLVTHNIAEQIGDYGIYGEIEMLVAINNESYQNLNLVPLEPEFKRWEPGIIFGAAFVIEHCKKRIGLDIKVTDIKFNDVDTTNVVIAYITYKAILSAIKLELSSSMFFDKHRILFELPK
jgi:hypothetical protein